MEKDLIGLAIILAQAVLAALTWRKLRDGNARGETGEARKEHIAANLQTINEADIAMPETWVERIRLETRHAVASAVQVTALTLQRMPIKSDPELDEYRRGVLSAVLDAFREWQRDAQR